MSNDTKGPPGVPVGLCSGTGMTLMRAKAPFLVVPQVGHPDGVEHALMSTNNRARSKSGVLKRIDFLLATFPVGRGPRCPCGLSAGQHSHLEPELEPLQHHKKVLRQHAAVDTDLLQPVNTKVSLVLQPIVEIPVDAEGESVGVIVERGDESWRKGIRAEEVRTGRLGLEPVVPERDFPGSPSQSLRGRSF